MMCSNAIHIITTITVVSGVGAVIGGGGVGFLMMCCNVIHIIATIAIVAGVGVAIGGGGIGC